MVGICSSFFKKHFIKQRVLVLWTFFVFTCMGRWVGIELDEPMGHNNGTVKVLFVQSVFECGSANL